MNEETLFTWKCKVCGHERQIDSRYEVPIKFIENREEYHCYYCERKKEFNENDLQEILEWIKYNKRDELNFEELRTNIIKVIEEAQKHLTALAALRAENEKLKTWDCTYCDIKALNAVLEARVKELEGYIESAYSNENFSFIYEAYQTILRQTPPLRCNRRANLRKDKR